MKTKRFFARVLCALLMFVPVFSFTTVAFAAGEYCSICNLYYEESPVCPVCHTCCICGEVSETLDVCSVCGADAQTLAEARAEAEAKAEESGETAQPTEEPARELTAKDKEALTEEASELFTLQENGVIWPKEYPYPAFEKFLSDGMVQYLDKDVYTDAKTQEKYSVLHVKIMGRFYGYEKVCAYIDTVKATGLFPKDAEVFFYRTDPIGVLLKDGGTQIDVDVPTLRYINMGRQLVSAAADAVGAELAQSTYMKIWCYDLATKQDEDTYWQYYAPQYEPQGGLYHYNLDEFYFYGCDHGNDGGLWYTDAPGWTTVEIRYVFPSSAMLPAPIATKAPEKNETEETPAPSAGKNRIVQLEDGTYVTVDEDGNIVTGGSGGKVEQKADGTYVSVQDELPTPKIEDGIAAGVIALVLVGAVAAPIAAGKDQGGADSEPLVSGTPYTQSQVDHINEGKFEYEMHEKMMQEYERITRLDLSEFGKTRAEDGTWVKPIEHGYQSYDDNGKPLNQYTLDANRGESVYSELITDQNGNIVASNDTICDIHTGEKTGASKTTYAGDGSKTVTRYDKDGNIVSEGRYDKNGRLLTDENGNIVSNTQYNANGTVSKRSYTISQTKQGSTGVGGYTETTVNYTVKEVYDSNGKLIRQQYMNAETLEVTTYDGSGKLLSGKDILPK